MIQATRFSSFKASPTAVQPQPSSHVLFKGNLDETEYQALAKQTKVNRRSNDGSLGVFFELNTERVLDMEDAMRIQQIKYFDPRGYGFHRFTQTPEPDGTFTYRWVCAGSSGN